MNYKRLMPAALLFVMVAFSAVSVAKSKPFDNSMSGVWLNHVTIQRVDGAKHKFTIADPDVVAPGEHVVHIRVSYNDYSYMHFDEYEVKATFAKGHIYSWQFDVFTKHFYFNDLGEGYEIPKRGMFSVSKEYTDATTDARSHPDQEVKFIPKDQWQ